MKVSVSVRLRRVANIVAYYDLSLYERCAPFLLVLQVMHIDRNSRNQVCSPECESLAVSTSRIARSKLLCM